MYEEKCSKNDSEAQEKQKQNEFLEKLKIDKNLINDVNAREIIFNVYFADKYILKAPYTTRISCGSSFESNFYTIYNFRVFVGFCAKDFKVTFVIPDVKPKCDEDQCLLSFESGGSYKICWKDEKLKIDYHYSSNISWSVTFPNKIHCVIFLRDLSSCIEVKDFAMLHQKLFIDNEEVVQSLLVKKVIKSKSVCYSCELNHDIQVQKIGKHII